MRGRRSQSSWTTPGSTTPRALTNLYTPRSGPRAHHAHLHAPPTPQTLGPTEHVRDAAKNNIANPRALAPQNTFAAFTAYITNRTFDYDFEHLPVTPPHTDLV